MRRLFRNPVFVTPARPRLQLVGLEDRSVPASFTVDSLSETAVAGKTTLREALATAAGNGEDDTIFLAANLSGASVTLGKGPLVVGETGKALDISFSDLTPPVLDGGKAVQLVSVPAGATVSISRLTLANGKGDKGGAVFNAGALTLAGVTVRGSEAATGGGGIFTDTGSSLSVFNSTVSDNTTSGNGGGINDFGATKFTLSGSLVADNAASGLGGGVVAGNLTLLQSTVAFNASNDSGGGLWLNGQLLSVNSTVVGNQTDAAGAGTAKGGGVFLDATGTAKLSNTLVAGNVAGKTGATTPSDLGGTVVDPGSANNLVADAATSGGLVDGAAGNKVGVGGTGTRPLASIVAAAPAVNGGTGGPLTLALVAGSPAIDAGDKTLAAIPGGTALGEDARGFPFVRVAGANVDIGAFEFQNQAPVVTVPTTKLTILEDDPAGVTFTGAGNTIVVSDDAGTAPSYSVTLDDASGKGKISLGSTAGLTGVTGDGSAKVTFKAATVAAVNTALAGVKFVVGPDLNGSQGFQITVDDGDATAAGGAKSGQGSVAVAVTPVIDTPSVTSPSTAKDTPVTVTFARNPVDGSEIAFFKVSNLTGGTLSYSSSPLGPGTKQIAAGDATLFAGSFFLLQPDPETKLLFTPTAGFEGRAGFTIEAGIGFYNSDPQTPRFDGPKVTSVIAVGNVPADTTAPTAKLAAAANVTTLGGTKYDFTVTYTDDVLVSGASLDGNDIRVTGPNGFSALAAFVSAAPTGDSPSVTATYRLTPPGGAWAAGNVGTYTLALEANQVLDTSNNKAAAVASLGTFTVTAPAPADTLAPTAKFGTATAGTGGAYTFTVAYADNTAVNGASLDSNDVRVTGPGGFNQLATFVSAAPTGNGPAVTATYKVTVPTTATATFTLALEANQVLDTAGNKAAAVASLGTFTFTAANTAPKPTLVGFQQFAVGTDRGGDGSVRFFNADGSARLIDPILPFGNFAGGVRTAAADFNGDGVADIAVGTGPGRATQVQVFDGATLKMLFSVDPFEASFTGGVFVAAGDTDGDGKAELVVTPDEGGGPVVAIYNPTGTQLARFFGIEDPNFRGGARAAVGDMDGDGKADILVAAGFGGGPRIAGFSGAGVKSDGAPPKLFNDFFAFESTLRNGTFVAVGDTDGDGKAEIIAGGGPGGGPRVSTFSVADVSAGRLDNRLADYFAGDINSRGGVRLAVKNVDGDNKADILTGAGAGAGSRVVGYTGKALAANSRQPDPTGGFDAVGGFAGGVFVG